MVHETPRLPKSHMVDGILPYVGLFMLVRRSVRGRIHLHDRWSMRDHNVFVRAAMREAVRRDIFCILRSCKVIDALRSHFRQLLRCRGACRAWSIVDYRHTRFLTQVLIRG
jgi:hypothetical protein